jgi:hypothetical protein
LSTTTAATTNASNAKGETTTAQADLCQQVRTMLLLLHTYSLILTEIELLTAHPNTFGKFLSSLVQGKRAAASSGLEHTAAYHETHGRSDNNDSPAQALKVFFSVQLKHSGSSFALLVALLKKEADDDEPPIDISVPHVLSN